MKKVLALLLAMAMVLAMTACAASTGGTKGPANQDSKSSSKEYVPARSACQENSGSCASVRFSVSEKLLGGSARLATIKSPRKQTNIAVTTLA